jgi:tRNA-specific 2-thiouridylase
VRCNRGVKIPELLAIADSLGADRVATGHYARVVRDAGVVRLRRAVDLDKDQSYFLHAFGPEVLARLSFPVGELEKGAVRSEALALGLPGASKGESQELCFVPAGRYDAFVEERAREALRPGWLVDGEGNSLARHEGIHRFTIGQRRNLGVATGARAYVTEIDVGTATVRLGKREELLSDGALLGNLVLHPGVTLPLECEVAVRYRGTTHAATVVSAAEGRAEVRFFEPVSAVVPGQVAVLYRGDLVLGGGTILPQERSVGHRLPVVGAPVSRA